jgi:hypothetical protein
MSWWWREYWPEVVIVATALAIVVLVVALAVFHARIDAQCLRAGYPGSTYDYALNAYCVKRVDQTDVVVPLSEVRGK